ncbi:MAG: HU family DNA-binding protein [Vicinamibacteraceae bacterium]|nr:HU family DNA-binding protein [Vicinamibacteraceae bacterium]
MERERQRPVEGASMNKQDLIAKIVKDTGITKTAAAGAIDSMLDGIRRALKKGDTVSFVGFGTFKTSQRKARTARNPQTGAAIKIPKRRVVRFTVGKALKDAIK